jgi:hypothetical protein
MNHISVTLSLFAKYDLVCQKADNEGIDFTLGSV